MVTVLLTVQFLLLLAMAVCFCRFAYFQLAKQQLKLNELYRAVVLFVALLAIKVALHVFLPE